MLMYLIFHPQVNLNLYYPKWPSLINFLNFHMSLF